MKHLRGSSLGLLTIAILVGMLACRPASTPAPTATSTSKDVAVSISGFAFTPETVQVVRGAKVTWTNNDSVSHTVTGPDTLFDSGPLVNGATFSYTFNQPGTFEYRCTLHPSMIGKVIVQ